MTEKVLCVDDDANIVEAYKRGLRKQFDITGALGGREGLQAVKASGPFAVVVSDLRMPGMDGIQFLSSVRKMSPDTVRMMLTGNAELETAIEAVNEGHIFRFLTKPCPPQDLSKALYAGIRQHQLLRSEKVLLENTLGGTMKILTEILSMVCPAAFGRATRIRRWVSKIAESLELSDAWRLEVAAMLSQVGCITIPTDVLEKVYGQKALSSDERRMFEKHPLIGRGLIENIPRMQEVAEIVGYQEKHFNGGGFPPDEICGNDIPKGARILHVALDYDTHLNDGVNGSTALRTMRQKTGFYDPQILEALDEVCQAESGFAVRDVGVDDLLPGMILAQDVRTTTNLLLVSKGQEVTSPLKERLKNFARTMEVKEPIEVHIPSKRSPSR